MINPVNSCAVTRGGEVQKRTSLPFPVAGSVYDLLLEILKFIVCKRSLVQDISYVLGTCYQEKNKQTNKNNLYAS